MANTPRMIPIDVVPEAKQSEAIQLIAYALHLRMYGERAPGGNETWAEWDRLAEAFLRSLIG